MESLTDSSVLQFRPDTLEAVRKEFGFANAEEMSRAVDILDAWVKQQDHFTKKDFDREYLERVIISGKGSIERSKRQLDGICTMKTLMPKFFEDVDVREDCKDIYGEVLIIGLPKQTKENHRIVVLAVKYPLYESTLVLHTAIHAFMLCEYGKRNDYSSAYSLLVDYTKVDLKKALSNPNLFNEIRELLQVLIDGYKFRVAGIHIVTKSTLINVVLDFLRQVLSRKIAGKIHLHRSMESVHEFIPREVLPEEYGGEEKKTIDEIHEELIDVLYSEEQRAYRLEMYRARTDESRRQVTEFNDLYMGMPGTFRTLSVD